MRRLPVLLSAPALAVLLLVLISHDASAQANGVEAITTVESRFPDGIAFDVAISSPVDIVEARVRYRVLGERVSRYAHLEFSPSRKIETGPVRAHGHRRTLHSPRRGD